MDDGDNYKVNTMTRKPVVSKDIKCKSPVDGGDTDILSTVVMQILFSQCKQAIPISRFNRSPKRLSGQNPTEAEKEEEKEERTATITSLDELQFRPRNFFDPQCIAHESTIGRLGNFLRNEEIRN
ncbi:hypothetical protein QVD17_35247 [Tagetes erecta]|uniref:Uncharacterized protein n=1 Tax=Tagetes erecta TaxID=13708 RepID=A0AAD8K0N3_TARER|nr:hypothetical protein QVD17_35247 [Tagetes erecta]